MTEDLGYINEAMSLFGAGKFDFPLNEEQSATEVIHAGQVRAYIEGMGLEECSKARKTMSKVRKTAAQIVMGHSTFSEMFPEIVNQLAQSGPRDKGCTMEDMGRALALAARKQPVNVMQLLTGMKCSYTKLKQNEDADPQLIS
jgi:hypothetical protein